MVILHGDLPNLQPEDVTTLVGALPADGRPGVAIAPDRAGTGTNGLVLQPPGLIHFRFGVGSFAKHVAEVEAAGVPLVAVNRAGLAFDLDTPADSPAGSSSGTLRDITPRAHRPGGHRRDRSG